MTVIHLATIFAKGLNAQQGKSQSKHIFVLTRYMAKLYLHTNSSLRNRDTRIAYQFPRLSSLRSLSFDLIRRHTVKSSQGVSQVATVIQIRCYCNRIIQV
jgi:hypothetical protein